MASRPDIPEPSFLALIEAVLSLAAPPLPRPHMHGPPLRPGGHSEDIFTDLTEEEKEEFECSICYQIMKETMQCINKHKYCFNCISTWSTSGIHLNRTRCPVCRANGYYTHDQDLDEKINKKEVKCTMKGCKWTGALLYLGSHKHTNYEASSSPSFSKLYGSKDETDRELPLLRRRNAIRQPPAITRTGLDPARHLHFSAAMGGGARYRSLNNLSDSNNNTISAGVRDGVVMSRDNPENVAHTPRPPSTPRPTGQPGRRVPTLPMMLNRPESRNVAAAPTPEQPTEPTEPTPGRVATRARVSNTLTQIRDRLHDSRSRIDTLMTSFGLELDQRQQEVIDMNAERERHRQAQLEEVQNLSRRLGQVATELRQLLNQRASFRNELNNLSDD